MPTGTVLGGLAPAAAAELGLLPGTPVVAGTGDLHSAAVGSGAVADFDAHLYIGTSSWISCHVPFKKTDALTNIASIPSGIPRPLPRRRRARDRRGVPDVAARQRAVPGRRAALGGGGAGGGGGVPAEVLRHAQRRGRLGAPGPHGVLFTPWLNGERSPVDDHTIRGGFHNLSLSSTRSDMVRAVFEGVALNSAWLLGAVEKFCKRRFDSLAFVGGRRQLRPVVPDSRRRHGAHIRQVADPVLANVRGAGCSRCSPSATSRWTDIPGTVEVKAIYEPDPATAALYAGLLKEFVNLYKETKGIHKRLNGRRLHAWRLAPADGAAVQAKAGRTGSHPPALAVASGRAASRQLSVGPLRHDQRQRRRHVLAELRAQVDVGVRADVDVEVLGRRAVGVVDVDVVARPRRRSTSASMSRRR